MNYLMTNHGSVDQWMIGRKKMITKMSESKGNVLGLKIIGDILKKISKY